MTPWRLPTQGASRSHGARNRGGRPQGGPPDYVPSPGQVATTQGLQEHHAAIAKAKVIDGLKARLENIVRCKGREIDLSPAPHPPVISGEKAPGPSPAPERGHGICSQKSETLSRQDWGHDALCLPWQWLDKKVALASPATITVKTLPALRYASIHSIWCNSRTDWPNIFNATYRSLRQV